MNGLTCHMLVFVCLLGVNLNTQAKPEKLAVKRYNWYLHPSFKSEYITNSIYDIDKYYSWNGMWAAWTVHSACLSIEVKMLLQTETCWTKCMGGKVHSHTEFISYNCNSDSCWNILTKNCCLKKTYVGIY